VNDLERFKSIVATYYDENFLVLPAGGSNVRIIHRCFVHGDPGSPTVVVGISGVRRTSPFKTINSNQAVTPFAKPRATRGGGNDIFFVPSMEEFLGCENFSDFKDLTPTEGEFPASPLWGQAQSFWLHPLIFEIAEGSPTQRAANLALAIIEALSGNLASKEEMQAEDRGKEVHNLLLFLWAVEKSLTTKVTLGDPP
jgi:hypothetical protein